MDKLQDQSQLIKKDLLMVLGLVIIFLVFFIGLYLYDLKTGILSDYAADFYTFLIN